MSQISIQPIRIPNHNQTLVRRKITVNHNQTLIRPIRIANHNQTVIRTTPGLAFNHNQTIVRR